MVIFSKGSFSNNFSIFIFSSGIVKRRLSAPRLTESSPFSIDLLMSKTKMFWQILNCDAFVETELFFVKSSLS
jgi:hypothetical protein